MTFSLPASLGLPSLDSTIGAVYIGLICGIMLYGLTLYQTYKYYTLYPSDRLGLKCYITLVLCFETFHSLLWTIAGYHYLISEAFDIVGLLDAHWSVRLTVLITGFTVFTSQCFYAHRVYYIGPQYRWLAIPAVLSMITGISFAIAAGVEAFQPATRYITDFKRFSWLVSAAYGFSVASDIILTSALVFVLRRIRTGSRRSNTVLGILITYTINTGLLTSIISVLAFIFALILPGNLIYAGVSIVSAKLYANSLLAVVNSRKSVGNRFLDDFTTNVVSGHARTRLDVEASLVWNVHQPTTGFVTESVNTTPELSATFAASSSDVEKPEERPDPQNEKRPNFTATV
ncbi:hypothetical protein C2E23DRAFT_886902 [Lenzites betulinus]|nr:hypothetical protein C2E23DRAFT_886902 [Lenzites betulinus]